MNLLAKYLVAGVIVFLPAQAIAATDPAKCMTHEEFRSVAATLMPSVLDSVMRKCTASLDKSSYLVAKGPDLLTRYQENAKGKEGALANVLARLEPIPELKGVPPEKLGTVVDVFIGAALQNAVKPEQCGDISQALSYFDPLPPENLIGFADFALTKMQDSEAKKRALNPVRAKKKGGFDIVCSSVGPATVAGK
jgi:hypothetical protein